MSDARTKHTVGPLADSLDPPYLAENHEDTKNTK